VVISVMLVVAYIRLVARLNEGRDGP
jgi:hypothetical protein